MPRKKMYPGKEIVRKNVGVPIQAEFVISIYAQLFDSASNSFMVEETYKGALAYLKESGMLNTVKARFEAEYGRAFDESLFGDKSSPNIEKEIEETGLEKEIKNIAT